SRAPRRGYATLSVFFASSVSRSTSIVHSFMNAAIAPMAASTGARTVPMTPTVSGNSAMMRSPCLMVTRRTLPSWMILFTASITWPPATLNDSVNVSGMAPSCSLIARSVLDDDIDALQQGDIAQHVAADGDDVRVFAR